MYVYDSLAMAVELLWRNIWDCQDNLLGREVGEAVAQRGVVADDRCGCG